MHPVTKTFYGVHGIACSFYNGTALTTGYITQQIGTNRFLVTDGVIAHPKTCSLAQTNTQVSGLGSANPTWFTILVEPPAAGASGATFTPSYGLESAGISNGGSGFATSDALVVTGAVRASGSLTVVSNPAAAATVTLNGTVITFRASGATGNEVNIGADATGTATALYTFLTGSADAQLAKCWYVRNGTTITLYSRTSGTTNNAFTLASSSGAVTVSGATLTGGTADVGTGGAATVSTVNSGVITAVTISSAGTFATLPTNPVWAYFAGNAKAPARLTARFKVLSITSSGGTGYAVNDVLTFSGISATQMPQAHISVASSGAATTVVVDAAGAGITTAPTSIGVGGVAEHVKSISNTACWTVEGNHYYWRLGSSVGNSAMIARFSSPT